MPNYSIESIETITDLATHSINHKLRQALVSDTKLNLNQSFPANVVALNIFRKYNLLLLHADFLLNAPVTLTEKGKQAAAVGLEAYLDSNGDSVRNYADQFVREQMKAAV
ncbi:MAG TPA: hypothetical protein PKE07_08110 [Lacibacter sp.]|nr:hypothetical protein [Lacibacter sp.]HMO89870.1 hypothetical protein [Lacibacter sp.]